MIYKPQFIKDGILSEYPRPQFKRDSYLSLNGLWAFKIINNVTKEVKLTKEILVPYPVESKKSMIMTHVDKDDLLVYTKEITLPNEFLQDNLLLNIGASDQITYIYVNDELIHTNYGGYHAFSVDLTPYIKELTFTLKIEVTDNTDTHIYGRGKQKNNHGGIWYTPVSGIWQSIWLESTPKDYLKGVKITPLYNERKLNLVFDKTNDEKAVVICIYDDEEKLYQYTTTSKEVTLDVKNVQDWTPDAPHLAKLTFTYDLDTVESYFGLRRVSKLKVKDKYYFGLNNEPIFHNGLLDQGYFLEGIYTPSTNEDMYNEIKSLKDMGFNMLRKHIKIEPDLWYYYCDILGMMVWQDMVNGGDEYSLFRITVAPFLKIKVDDTDFKKMGRDDELSRQQYMIEAKQTIKQLYNHPSIMLWTPFNEGWGQFDSINVCRQLKQIDDTRLYDNTSGWFDTFEGDLNSKHIYFRKVKLKNDYKRILALTEFGGYSLKLHDHAFTDKTFGYKLFKTKEALQKSYTKLYETEIIPLVNEGLSATVYTQVTDVEDEVNGLYTYDRVFKLDKEEVKRINKKLLSTFNSQF